MQQTQQPGFSAKTTSSGLMWLPLVASLLLQGCASSQQWLKRWERNVGKKAQPTVVVLDDDPRKGNIYVDVDGDGWPEYTHGVTARVLEANCPDARVISQSGRFSHISSVNEYIETQVNPELEELVTLADSIEIDAVSMSFGVASYTYEVFSDIGLTPDNLISKRKAVLQRTQEDYPAFRRTVALMETLHRKGIRLLMGAGNYADGFEVTTLLDEVEAVGGLNPDGTKVQEYANNTAVNHYAQAPQVRDSVTNNGVYFNGGLFIPIDSVSNTGPVIRRFHNRSVHEVVIPEKTWEKVVKENHYADVADTLEVYVLNAEQYEQLPFKNELVLAPGMHWPTHPIGEELVAIHQGRLYPIFYRGMYKEGQELVQAARPRQPVERVFFNGTSAATPTQVGQLLRDRTLATTQPQKGLWGWLNRLKRSRDGH